MKETDARCVEYGVLKYFMKPFNPVELVEAIQDLVSSGQFDKDRVLAS